DSVASKVCDAEIAYARGIGKRIISILRRSIDFSKIASHLSAPNIKLSFSDDQDIPFAASLKKLSAALDVDIEWHRESRRLTGLAVRWDRQGRSDDLLLTASDILAIGSLLERRPRDTPDPPSILVDLRDRSRAKLDRQARARQRMRA